MSSPLKGSNAPEEILTRQEVVAVRYRGFDGAVHDGEIVVDRDLAGDVRVLFDALLAHDFPLTSVIPIAAFGWDDMRSMTANNSSGFNYRPIAGTDRLSYHALGRAIDLNPALNPYFREDIVEPPGAVYEPGEPGVIAEGDFITALIDELGWEWGGRWTDRKDYQHFQKPFR